MVELNLSGVSSGTPENDKPLEILILGSGPAGLSAALYAARAELSPVVLTGLEPGGQVALTYAIENYPGFPEGVGGSELSGFFQKQAERFGARVVFDSAVRVDLSKRPFQVHTDSRQYQAKTLIIATGASPNHLNIPGEAEFTGKGVSYCATCDGWFFKDKKVVVVGGGDSALEEGILLTRYASSVTIIHRRDVLRANAILQKQAKEKPKLKFVWDSIITSIDGKDTVESVQLRNVSTGEVSTLLAEGVFIYIGHSPNTQLFQNQLVMNEHGYIQVDNLMQTSLPGVFAAGEVADRHFRQVVTSAGMGAAAAIQAVRFLENQHR